MRLSKKTWAVIDDKHSLSMQVLINTVVMQADFNFYAGKFHMYSAIWSKDLQHMSRVMKKLDFCLCENKGADQRVCFRYSDTKSPLLSKAENSSF